MTQNCLGGGLMTTPNCLGPGPLNGIGGGPLNGNETIDAGMVAFWLCAVELLVAAAPEPFTTIPHIYVILPPPFFGRRFGRLLWATFFDDFFGRLV